jgi:hypothetical protein
MTGESSGICAGISAGTRTKPSQDGRCAAFVPGLDLVVPRQTGGRSNWAFEEHLRRACLAVARKLAP